MTRPQKLELTWVGKDDRPKLEPRILLEDPELSCHGPHRVTEHDIYDNMLILGDNLLALKALEHEYAGKVKCIFIDPPYNTGSAFEHYDDGMEHSLWLSMMQERLELLRKLLSNDGSIWITIDDNEGHYLKVVCDEVFGRNNFVATCVWEKDKGGRGDAVISTSQDFVLVYARELEVWRNIRNLLPRTETQHGRFQNPDNDPRGPWRQGDDGTAKSGSERQRFPITLPSGREVRPKRGRYWAFSHETFEAARREGRVWFGRNGDRLPVIKRYLSEVREGVAPRTWWPADEVGSNQAAKRDHLRRLLPDVEPFETPKPEGLLHRIILIATNAGDLVVDSFLGSGTTAAVAHKMGRRWIGVELGDQARTHCIPRLTKVLNGEDPGGVTETVGWKGGGGFRVYRLAPSLLEKDAWGNWVISKQYKAAMLAEALCKHEGFRYEPDAEVFWQHGRSTERDFLYVTTQTLTARELDYLSEQIGPNRSLLILCAAWVGRADRWQNLTLKKIPQAVLGRCEFGRDDYSLRVASLPGADVAGGDGNPGETSDNSATVPSRARRARRTVEETPAQQPSLAFDAAE